MNKRLEKVTRLTNQARADKNADKVFQGEYLRNEIRETENKEYDDYLNKLIEIRCKQATN